MHAIPHLGHYSLWLPPPREVGHPRVYRGRAGRSPGKSTDQATPGNDMTADPGCHSLTEIRPKTVLDYRTSAASALALADAVRTVRHVPRLARAR